MRVALVTEFYYPHLGGVSEHVHHLALELRRRGHAATVVTSNMAGQDADPPFVRRLGTSRLVYSNGSFARVTTGFGLRRRMTDLLRETGADVVHLQDALAPTLGLVASSAAWRMGLPVVGTFHTWFRRSPGYWAFRRFLQPRLDRLDARIAVSRPVVQAMRKYFLAEFEIIPNGVPVGYFHPNGRRPDDALTLGPRLLFLGRLDPRNGLDTVLAAMPAILAAYPATRLTVVGDGPLRRVYQRKARLLGDRVRFAGAVFAERPEYYGTTDLYLCPTTKASFGITLLEAMASGTPMIVSDITGFRELVDGGAEAVLVPKDDPAAWAAAATALIGDPARRTRMGAAGLVKASRFAWPRIADQVLAVYERVKR